MAATAAPGPFAGALAADVSVVDLDPRAGGAELVTTVALEIEARHSAQFQRQAHRDDAQTFADQPGIAALEIERRGDADRIQPGRQPAGNAPQIGELDARQGRVMRRLIEQQHRPPCFSSFFAV